MRRAATAILVRNDVSNEATPSFVGFKGPERFVGEEALTQYARNCANTVSALPGLLGAATLSLPDGRDFIARGLSAIALLDAELAVPPGDAHVAIGAAAAPPIQGLLSGPPGARQRGRVAAQCRLACDATGGENV